MKSIFLGITFVFISSCSQQPKSIHQTELESNLGSPNVNLSGVQLGLDILLNEKIDLIKNKNIALVTNHSGVDSYGIPNYESLMKIKDIHLKIIFSPEHGLFGEAAAGEKVNYNGQIKTLPEVVSLYGKNRKPTFEQMENLDYIIYDIQDVGARFYTYITTLGLIMETASESGVKVLVLDRPNPIKGKFTEGPILDLKYQTFVGYYPIPIRYGLTVGELANMIQGEKWIEGQPSLEIIKMKGWKRDLWFNETNLKWIKPSPNIPDLTTAIIYPGMCLLEGTNISEGRGTNKPFKRFGAPWIDKETLSAKLNNLNLPGVVFKPISFIPTSIKGMSVNPKFKNQVCYGSEIIVTDREKYLSVITGMEIINLIKKTYPSNFKLKQGINRLWGNTEFIDQISTENKDGLFRLPLEKFNRISKRYWLYD